MPILGNLATKFADFVAPQHEKCLLLPCAFKRPYYDSATYRRIYETVGNPQEYHKVTITSLGVIPEEFWGHDVVRFYDCGVPDLWRVFELMERYFRINKYKEYRNFVEYKPYLKMMRMVGIILDENKSEGKIKQYIA